MFEDVRQYVLVNWQTRQQETFNADFFENLKGRYEIVVAEIPVDRLVGAKAKDEVEAAGEPAS